MYKSSSSVRKPFKPPRPISGGAVVPISKVTASLGPLKRKRVDVDQAHNETSSSPKSPHLTSFIPPSQNDTSLDSSDTPPSSQGCSVKYLVQWRKVTNKKNKTWNGDGIIHVKGDMVTAKIDNRTISKSIPNTEGIFKIGSYEVEIDCQLDEVPAAESAPRPRPQLARVNQVPKFKKTITSTTPRQKKPLYTRTDDSFVLKKAHEQDTEVIMDPSLNKVLRPHQREGISFMYEAIMGYNFDGNGVLLADEMGLGKTLMTIALIWTLLKQSPDPHKSVELNKVLIICPVTLINNWQKEFKKWLNMNQLGVLVIDNNTNTNTSTYKQVFANFNKSKVHQVMIMSYERLLTVESEICNCQFDLLVCDEGHKLKNNANKSLKILNDLDIQKKILLTGTPIQNNLGEFYNLINFINPGILGSFSKFQRNYIKPIENSRDVNCFNKEIIRLGKQASKDLTEIVKKMMLRRTNEILFKYLSSKTDVLVFVKPTPLQLELFDLVLSKISFSSVDNMNVLNLINVFKKICGSPSLLADDSMFKSLVPSYDKELAIASGKVEALIALLLEIINFKKEKVVIVSNYTKTLDIIESIVRKLSFESVRLDGSTNSATRGSIINKFNTVPFPKYPIFLLSSKSGGFGINLIGASRLILFDNDWNPANDLQAMSRVYRDGQTKPVVIYRLFTTGCLDEKVFQRQLMKSNLSDKFLDDGKHNSNVFDMDDLKDLFTVNRSTKCNTHDLLECGCEGWGTNENQLFLGTQEPDIESSVLHESSGEEEVGETGESLGVMSALSFSQKETDKKPNIKNALSDYKHFDPANDDLACDDDVTNNIIKKIKERKVISYILTKVSNAAQNELEG